MSGRCQLLIPFIRRHLDLHIGYNHEASMHVRTVCQRLPCWSRCRSGRRVLCLLPCNCECGKQSCSHVIAACPNPAGLPPQFRMQTSFRALFESKGEALGPNCPPQPLPVSLPNPLPEEIQNALQSLDQLANSSVNTSTVVCCEM